MSATTRRTEHRTEVGIRDHSPSRIAVWKWAFASLVLLFAVQGCQKYQGPETKDVVAKKEKKKPEAAVAKKTSLTAPERAQQLFKTLDEMMDGCVADHLVVVRENLAKVKDNFLPTALNRMDHACRPPIALYARAERKLVGKLPELDDSLLAMARFADAYQQMVDLLRQLGTLEALDVYEGVSDNLTILFAEADRVHATAQIVGDKDWLKIGPQERTVEPSHENLMGYEALAQSLCRRLDERFTGLVEDYRRFAFEPAQTRKNIYNFQFRYAYRTTRAWFDHERARFTATRCSGGKGCAKITVAMNGVFTAVDDVLKGYVKGMRLYKKGFKKKLGKALPLEKKLSEKLRTAQEAIETARRLR